jgi:hypothetical protein
VMIVDPHHVASLHLELDALNLQGHRHPQISALNEVVARAISEGCTLTVHGDMYPELPNMMAPAEPPAQPSTSCVATADELSRSLRSVSRPCATTFNDSQNNHAIRNRRSPQVNRSPAPPSSWIQGNLSSFLQRVWRPH